MEYNSKQILDALRHVKHPESNKDIVSLDMVKDIKIEGKKISFSLIFQKPNDPLINSLKKACVNAILTYVDKNAEIKGNITAKDITIVDDEKPMPGVKNIIAIASGKGGVGKSTIATNLAVAIAKSGAKVGLIDADIYGPSIPKMFNVEKYRPSGHTVKGVEMIIPITNYGVKMLSIGFFVNPDDALVWRGPMATKALKQLINQSDWGELDYMFVDLPPGTSDIHLTLVQTVPVTGAIIVSTPQDVALADAIKGINMFRGEMINVPILGLIENMSWFTPEELPDNKYYIFGKDGCKNLANRFNVPLLGQIPIVQSIREGGDAGHPSALDENSLVGKIFIELGKNVVESVINRNKNIAPTKIVGVKSN